MRADPEKIRLESRLLADCASVASEIVRLERVSAAIGRGVDWERLVVKARQHGVLALLFSTLRAIDRHGAPSHVVAVHEALSRLTSAYHADARRNLALTAELVRLLDLLDRHQVRAVSYKGPLVATSLYDNLAMRPFRDLDVLIDRASVPRTTELLISTGYRPVRPLSVAQEHALLDVQTERSFATEAGACVDLHWHIAPKPFGFQIEPETWDRLETVSLGGRLVRTFSAGDLLLFLCVHGAVHAWERLIWIADIARLVDQRADVDWDQVVARASRSGTRRALSLGLLVARDLLFAPLPVEVEEQARSDRTAKALAERVANGLLTDSCARTQGPARRYVHVIARERAIDRWRYATSLLFGVAPVDKALPPSPSVIHYVVWPVRQAQKLWWERLAQ